MFSKGPARAPLKVNMADRVALSVQAMRAKPSNSNVMFEDNVEFLKKLFERRHRNNRRTYAVRNYFLEFCG